MSSIIDLNNDPPHLVDRMVQFLYHSDYSTLEAGGDAHDKDLKQRRLLLHVDLYALADRYDIGGLATLARDNYNGRVDFGADALCAIETIPRIYASTPESNRGLRDIVVRGIKKHSEDVFNVPAAKAQFYEIFLETPQFALDMVSKALENSCTDCDCLMGRRLCGPCSDGGWGGW